MVSNTINWVTGESSLNPDEQKIPKDMRSVIAQIKALPPLPGTALKILNLISDPKADAQALAHIIEDDPIVTAQLIRWASSPLYGYQGKISSVHDAITRVLGFNFVLDLALGLSVLAPLKAPKQGLIGTRMFWVHALASTRLMQKLSEYLPTSIAFNQNEVFLVALLHNIGFPVFGHQFPVEFDYLSRLLLANPHYPVYSLETAAFAISHGEIGAWLLKAWSFPAIVSEVVCHHHNPDYRGHNYHLNLLTYLNDYLLGQIGIGDGGSVTCPDEVWSELFLDPGICQEILVNLQVDIEQIQAAADSLTG